MAEPLVIPASRLAAGLADAVLFTSSDDDLPTLQRIEVSAGPAGLVLRATDSYASIERVVEPDTLFPGLPDADTVVGLVHRDEAELVVRLLRQDKKAEAEVVTYADHLVVRVAGRSFETERLNLAECALPSTAGLAKDAEPTGTIGLAGWQLARLAKLTQAKVTPIAFAFAGDVAATRWSCGEFSSGLVMPVRGEPGPEDQAEEDEAGGGAS